MVVYIEKELDAAMTDAVKSGDPMLLNSYKLAAVAGSTGGYSVEVEGDKLEDAFPALDQMVNDTDVPIERARQIRLFLAWKGHLRSQYMEGENFRLGRNTVQDYNLARYWYTKAAKGGHAGAQNNLGVMCAEGLGGPADQEKAVYWYMKSAESGDATAKGNLGMHFAEGSGIRRNYLKAARLLKESLKSNPYDARDHQLLAECYEHGVAGRNGLRLALYHYQEASDFGSLKARAALRRLSKRK
jgi:hypothetical protein